MSRTERYFGGIITVTQETVEERVARVEAAQKRECECAQAQEGSQIKFEEYYKARRASMEALLSGRRRTVVFSALGHTLFTHESEI